MLAQMGLASLAALLLEVNALVLAAMAWLFCTHELTTWWELRYVAPVRPIALTEQMVHSFMEIIPWGRWPCWRRWQAFFAQCAALAGGMAALLARA